MQRVPIRADAEKADATLVLLRPGGQLHQVRQQILQALAKERLRGLRVVLKSGGLLRRHSSVAGFDTSIRGCDIHGAWMQADVKAVYPPFPDAQESRRFGKGTG